MPHRHCVVTDIDRRHSQFPKIGFTDGGEQYICWQEYDNRQDRMQVASFHHGQIVWEKSLSGEGQALFPSCCAHGDTMWFAWSECVDRKWRIYGRSITNEAVGAATLIAEGDALFHPHLFVYNDAPHLVWNEQTKGSSRVRMCSLSGPRKGQIETVSLAQNAYRPVACEGGDGRLYLAYDAFSGVSYDLLARVKTSEGWGPETRLDLGDDWATFPTICPSENGATVAWYAMGDASEFSYVLSDLKVVDRALKASTPFTVASGTNWFQNISLAGKDGLQALAYTWDKESIHIRYRRAGEPWSGPAYLSFNDGDFGLHPHIAIQQGAIHGVWQFANRNGHRDRNASIIYTKLDVSVIDDEADEQIDRMTNPFTKPIEAAKELPGQTDETVRTWLDKNGYTDRELKFGDIHGQSVLSDGMGEIDQYFYRAKVKANLDFAALTDHDCYPDWMSQSEWEYLRTLNDLHNDSHHFVNLLAYEWTSNEYRYDFGHKNVYYPANDGELYRSGDPEGMTPNELFDSIKKWGGQCIPHHPSADWGIVSAATDWDFHDPEVQRLVEIYSRHAAFEAFESRSDYTKNISKMKKSNVQDALAMGHRLGFTAGSDSHQMEHGVEGGIMAAFLPQLTRADLFQSMYDRQVYGTSGARILVSLKVDGHMMGSEITLPKGAPYQVDISVLGTSCVTVELICNNDVIKCFDNGTPGCDARVTEVGQGESVFYYLRVTQDDGHLAWSSPIWVDFC